MAAKTKPTKKSARYSDKRKQKKNSQVPPSKDATTQKQMKDDMVDSERSFTTLAEHAPDIIARLDKGLRYLYVNPAMEKATGIPRKRFIGKTNEELRMPEEFCALWNRIFKRVLRTGDAGDTEFNFPAPDGTRSFELRAVPESVDGGIIESVLAISRDITERKQAEEALRSSAERYRGLYEAISGGVIVQDRAGNILGANDAACAMLGLTQDQIQARTLQDPRWRAINEDGSPLPIDDRPSMRALRTGIPVHGQVMGVFNPVLEQYRWLLVNAEPILDPKTSQVQGTVSTFLDLTERKKREEELYRLNRTLTALSSSSQAMMRARNESEYMKEVCKIVVEDCGHKMVWIGFAEEDEAKNVRPVASAGFEEGYLETLRITWAATERGRGPTGTAIRTGQVSMCRNMLTDPNFAPWREQAIQRGYASSIVIPLMAGGKAFGAINIYSKEPDPFSEDEVRLLSELADDLAHGIMTLRLRVAREQAEVALRQSEERLTRAQEIAHLGSWELDLVNNRLSWSDEVYRIFGLKPQEFGATYEAFLEVVHPEDRAAVDDAYSGSLREGRDSYEIEHRVVRKDTGEIRVVHEKCEHFRDAAGKLVRSVGMVQDLTERKQAEEALRKAHDELEIRVRERTEDLKSAVEKLEEEITERRRAEDALRVASLYSRSLLEASLDPLVTISAEGKVTDVNKATELVTGISRDQLIGSDFSDYFTEPDKAQEGYRKVFSEGSVLDYPLAIRHISGRITDVLYNATVYKNEAGEVQGVFAAARDITARKQAESELRNTKEVLEKTMSSLVEAVFVVEPGNRTIIACNKAVETMFGYTEGEVIGRNTDFLYVNKKMYEEFGRRLFPALDERGVFHTEYDMRHKDGGVFPAEITVTEMLDDAGERTGVVSLIRDVTERVRAQEERVQLGKVIEEAIEDRLRLAVVMEQTAEGVLITDTNGTIEYVNSALERLSGYRRGELIGRTSDVLLPYAEAGEAMGVVRRGESWRGNIIRRRTDGTPLELDIIVSPVRNVEGMIINYVAIERDVTREMQLQRQMRQMQKMEALGTLAGGIAHDLNNILMPITVNTELALDTAAEGDPARRYLQQALEAVHRGTDLVRQITAFSRRAETAEGPSKILPVVKEALKLLRSSLPATIEIRQHIKTRNAVVQVDPIHIHQVFMNLCTNAADAMHPDGGFLEVSLTALDLGADAADAYLELKPGPYVKLTVADTGHGMDGSIKERIFDPFFTTKGPRGTGMGLAVVHGIVKRIEGGITVYSEKGKGTQFNVYFPRVQGRPEQQPPATPPPTGTERILFVDDDEAIVRSVQPLLERLGYGVTTAHNGPEALEVFRSRPGAFDLVITDQVMPRMTGIRLAEEVMRIRPGMPVILCTGFSETVNKRDTKARGIRAFIMKPLTIREMAETIRHALDSEA